MSDYSSELELPLWSVCNEPEPVIESRGVIEKPVEPCRVSTSEKKRLILQAFAENREISCFDVESRWHRGQATICALRDDGHVIDTVRGVYIYKSPPKSPMVKVQDSHKEKYWRSAHWRRKAKERKEIDGFACVQCGAKDNLETHHWRYELFNEEMKDLCTLCKICHEWMHECVKGSSVHFPNFLPQSVIDRITGEPE